MKIKKKKRLLTPVQEVVNTNYLNGLEEHGQEATKPRRKIVITRKRILPNRSKTLTNINPTSKAEPILTTTMLMENSNYNIQVEKSEIAKHFRENVDRSRFGKNFKFNLSNIVGDAGEREDRTEENLIEDEDSTEFINNRHEDGDVEEDGEDLEDEYDDDEDEFNDEDEDNFNDEEDDDEYTDDDDDNDDEEDNVTEKETNLEFLTKKDGLQSDDEANKTLEIIYQKELQVNDLNNANNKNINSTSTSQSPPEYLFPELSESTDVPVLLLKTTVISNVELETKTITTTRLRTYTFVVTRVAGDEEIITSTTEVKPQIKTTTVIESSTLFTTLTLLDLDNMDMTDVQPTFLPTLEYNPSSLLVSNLEGEFSFFCIFFI